MHTSTVLELLQTPEQLEVLRNWRHADTRAILEIMQTLEQVETVYAYNL